MIARIRLFFRQRKCRKVGHAWTCLHCYEPEVVGDLQALNLMTGEVEAVRLLEQKHKQTCQQCGVSRLATTLSVQPVDKFNP